MTTYTATRRLTFLPGSAAGRLPCGLPGGPTSGRCGPALAHASHSVSPAKGRALMTRGIYGPTYADLSAPLAPSSSWESRLRERLGMLGSTEYDLIWRRRTTPAGRSISRLAASTRRISETGCTGSPSGWPTPRAHAANQDLAKRDRSSTGMALEAVAVEMAGWPTPRCPEPHDSEASAGRPRKMRGGYGLELAEAAEMVGWATPAERDYRFPNAKPYAERGGEEGRAVTEPSSSTGGCGATDWVGDSTGGGRGELRQPVGGDGFTDRADAHCTGDTGFWDEWTLAGPDPNGKYRRVKPGLRLLAHGVPCRVSKLRAIGNAINAALAAEVIRAWMDTHRYPAL